MSLYTILAWLAILLVVCPENANTSYSFWKKSNGRGNQLFCPSHCDSEEHRDECCACYSKLCWELDNTSSNYSCNVTMKPLHVEYTDLDGTANLLVRPTDRNASYWSLTHKNGRLTSLPVNLCSFPSLTSAILSHNDILTIGDISCLGNLDVLQLDHNKLTSIPNSTFQNLSSLRFVDLSSNFITKIEPNTIFGTSLNIFRIVFSSNPVESIDVTNVYVEHPYCEITMEDTALTNLVNELDFKIDTSRTYGPGHINLKNCSILEFFNFTEIGIDNYENVQDIIHISADIAGNKIICDCGVGYALKFLPATTLKKVYRDIENVSCNAPAEVAGASIQELHATKNYSAMTCRIDKDCPRFCSCYDQPSSDRIVVNCTGANLTEMPKNMPTGFWGKQNLHVLLAGNEIRNVPPRNYINRIDNLDLSGNLLQDISEDAAKNLKQTVVLDISSHTMKTLPRHFQTLDPDLITFGNTTISCDCSNTWIGDWLRNKKSDLSDTVLCDVNGHILLAETITQEFLNCIKEVAFPFLIVGVGVGALTAILGIFGLMYTCRYELRFLARKIKSSSKKAMTSKRCLYDIFVSFCEDDTELRKWVNCSFLPHFTQLRYKLFIPCKDLPFGGSRLDDTSNAINKTIKFVIVLSQKYMQDEWTSHEFKCIWSKYLQDPIVKIIVVDFNNMSTGGVNSKKIRSLIRVGNSVDFSFRNERLLNRLQRKVGPPGAGQKADGTGYPTGTSPPPNARQKADEAYYCTGASPPPVFTEQRSRPNGPDDDDLFGEETAFPPNKSKRVSAAYDQHESRNVFDRLSQTNFERVCYKYNPDLDTYLCYIHKDKCSFGQLHRQKQTYSHTSCSCERKFSKDHTGTCHHTTQACSFINVTEPVADVEV